MSVHEEEAFPVVAHGASWDAFTNDAKSSFEERTGSIRECRRKRLQACCKNRSPYSRVSPRGLLGCRGRRNRGLSSKGSAKRPRGKLVRVHAFCELLGVGEESEESRVVCPPSEKGGGRAHSRTAGRSNNPELVQWLHWFALGPSLRGSPLLLFPRHEGVVLVCDHQPVHSSMMESPVHVVDAAERVADQLGG